jgi:hypothetical protein
MLKENILDSEYLDNESNEIYASINWWERKRLVFNLILIGVEILIISFFWRGAIQFGIGNTIFWSIAYTIAANIFFSIGWGISVLIDYYNLKFLKNIEKLRMFFFILGILFSIFLTIALFKDTLLHFQRIYLWG